MNFALKDTAPYTSVPPELLEVYQPIIGFEAVSVWLNLYHGLINGFPVSESSATEQMSITRSCFRRCLETLRKYHLIVGAGDEYTLCAPTLERLNQQIEGRLFPYEQESRFSLLIESFCLKRGQALAKAETAVATSSGNELTEQLADEFATRFIKECKFKPSRELRDRFELWFAQLTDRRLLEELLTRTKNKVVSEGVRGGCPSRYTDKIVRQWLVQGVKTYEDLLRLDKEFLARCEFYRVVETELGKDYDSLTPSEKEVVDAWVPKVDGVEGLRTALRRVILSGEYKGKGRPGIEFIDKQLSGGQKAKPSKGAKAKYSNLHKLADLERAVQRKTMIGMEEDSFEK